MSLPRTFCALFLLLLTAAGQSVHAQQAYLRAAAGWNFPFLTQTVTGDGNLYAGSIRIQQGTAGAEQKFYDLERASFGAGGTVTLAAGIAVNGQAGIEIAAAIGVFNRHFLYTATDTDEYGEVVTRTVDAVASRPIILTPAFCYRGASDARVVPYLRAGPALPLATERVVNVVEEFRGRPSFRDYTLAAQWVESSRFSVGMHAALGANISLGERTSVFAECSATALQVYIRRRSYTAFFMNGEDVMATLPEAERTVWYEKNFTDAGPTPTGALLRPSYSVPYSAVGVQAGICVGW